MKWDAIKRFHRQRHPFFLKPDGFIYVTSSYSGSHEMWAKQLDLPTEAMQVWPRGYYWPPTNELYFYYGADTRDYLAVVDSIRKAIKEIIIKVGGNNFTIINGGMIPAEPGTVWEPVFIFGQAINFQRGES